MLKKKYRYLDEIRFRPKALRGTTTKPDDPPDDETYYSSLPAVTVTADRPEWHRSLSQYDWARAEHPYYKANLDKRAEFLKNVASKKSTGKSQFMRDTDRLAAIPNAAVGAIGAVPIVGTALGLGYHALPYLGRYLSSAPVREAGKQLLTRVLPTIPIGYAAAEGVDSAVQSMSDGAYTGLPDYLNQTFFDGSRGTEQVLEFVRPEYGIAGTGARLLDRGINAASKFPMYAKAGYQTVAEDIKIGRALNKYYKQHGIDHVEFDSDGTYRTIMKNPYRDGEDVPMLSYDMYGGQREWNRAEQLYNEAKDKLNSIKNPYEVHNARVRSNKEIRQINPNNLTSNTAALSVAPANTGLDKSVTYNEPVAFGGVTGNRKHQVYGNLVKYTIAKNNDIHLLEGLVDGKIPTGTLTGRDVVTIDNSIRNAVKARFNEATTLAGEDGLVVGSSRTISDGSVDAIPHDIEFLTTAKRAEALQKKLQFTKTGTTAKNTGIKGTSKYGETDINIIGTDVQGNATGTQTEQILQTLYPEEFARYKQSLVDANVASDTFPQIKDGKFVYDPKRPEAGARLTDEDVYQLMRADDNASRVLENDMFSSIKDKHVTRATNLLLKEDKTQQVKSILDRLGRSKIGDSYQTIEQMYPNLRFDDIEANKEFLRLLSLPERYAENPEIMRNLAQRYAIANEYVTRAVERTTDVPLKDMFVTNYSFKAGSVSGPGGNALRSGYKSDSGSDIAASVVGIMRSRYTTRPETVKTLADYAKAIERARNRTIETALATPDGKNIIETVFKHNGIDVKGSLSQELSVANQWTDAVANIVRNVETDTKTADKKIKTIIDEVSKAFDSPRVDTRGYDNNYTGILELPTNLRMRQSGNNTKTYQRGMLSSKLEGITLATQGFNPEIDKANAELTKHGFVWRDGKIVALGNNRNIIEYLKRKGEYIRPTRPHRSNLPEIAEKMYDYKRYKASEALRYAARNEEVAHNNYSQAKQLYNELGINRTPKTTQEVYALIDAARSVARKQGMYAKNKYTALAALLGIGAVGGTALATYESNKKQKNIKKKD